MILPATAPGRSAARPPRLRCVRSPRAWFAATLSVALVVAPTVLAVVKLDPRAVAGSLTSAAGGCVMLAAVLMICAFIARAESWFAVIRAAAPGAPVRRLVVLRGLLIGMAMSTLAPGRVGEAARAWVIARRLGDPRRMLATVAGTVLSQTLLNVLALSILAVIALGDSAITHARIASLAVAVALPGGALIVLLAGPPTLRRAARSRHGHLQGAADSLLRQLGHARRGLAVFGEPMAAAHATAVQLGAWTLQLAACYALILALHLERHANLAAAAAVLVAVNITAILPVTPSNAGVLQAACAAALAPFGVAAGEAFAYGILLQGVEIACALALGAPALLGEGLSWSDLRHASGGRNRPASR